MKSLNSFADHAPKRDWLVSFFELKEDFFPEFMKVTLGLKADIKRPEEKFVLLDDDEN